MGIGDWPDTDRSGSTVLDLEQWAKLIDEDSKPLDPLCFAFDVSPDRSSSAIAVAGRRSDGLEHVEIAKHEQGTGWVVPWLVEKCPEHNVATVICDGASPAASLLEELDELGIEVQVMSSTDHSRACGLIFDLVDQGGLRHLGTAQLRRAIKGAKTRPLGDAWAWARTKSASDITPLVAVTLALAGSHAANEEGGVVYV